MLTDVSNQLADVVASSAPSVVQVQGRRRPASGVVYAEDVVVTMMVALGTDDGLRVRRHDGETCEAELVGWDPASGLAALRVPDLRGRPLAASPQTARVGQIGLAIARSWSNAVTASAGIVAVIGGPLRTGRRRAIDSVIRTTAPMHDGFAGGAFLGADGGLIGISTAAEIRGFGVVIPTEIAWKAIAHVLEYGGVRRGYLGIAGQPVTLPERQRAAVDRERTTGMLVVNVAAEGPAAQAGLLVGDIIVTFDSHAIGSPEDLLELLKGEQVGRQVVLKVLRGATPQEIPVTVSERPKASAQ